MLFFETTYKKLISVDSLFISENLKTDNTKDVYGYSLKTFIPQELELFNAFAEAIISDANKHKKGLVSACKYDEMAQQYGISLSIINDKTYQKIVNNFLKDPLLKEAHRNIYSPALIEVGVPSLRSLNENFVLKFKAHTEFETLCEEPNWKNNIIERLKYSVTNRFYDTLDWVGPKNDPLSKETRDFFDWREEKVKYIDLTTKLPELKGVFEQKTSNDKVYVFEVFVEKGSKPETNDVIRKLLLKCSRLFNIYFNLLGVVKEEINNCFIFKLDVPITIQSFEGMFKELKTTFTAYFSQEHKTLMKNIKNTNSTFFSLPEVAFKWTEKKVYELQKKLPELQGIFESNQTGYKFIATFDPTEGNDRKQLLKVLKMMTVISQSVSSNYGSVEEKVEITTNENKQVVYSVENSSKWDFEKESERNNYARAFYNAYNAIAPQFKLHAKYIAKFKSKYEDMVKKLPELEEIFEHIEDKKEQTYVLTIAFENLEQTDKYLLEKLLLHRQKNTQHKSTITKTSNSLTYIIFGLTFEISTSAKDQFERLFKRDITTIYPNLTVQGSEQFLARIFKHFKYSNIEESIYNLTNKLPELKGIFESAETTEEEFYFTKEETQAIERISEVIQSLFQKYEERLIALMKNTRRTRIPIQDSHFNKYVAVTHLRNDLRLQIGKICKELFQDEIGNKFGNTFYVLYERIFNKPLKGLDEVVMEGGVSVMLDQDDVFEVNFDTYDYNLNEQIISAKLIEPIEIKSFLKKLYAEWIKAIFLKRPLAFPKMYLELRRERLKYNKLKQKLPELEDIF